MDVVLIVGSSQAGHVLTLWTLTSLNAMRSSVVMGTRTSLNIVMMGMRSMVMVAALCVKLSSVMSVMGPMDAPQYVVMA
jgi:hypothetical protein